MKRGKKKLGKSKKLTIPRLRDKVWMRFSIFIRSRGSVNGYNKCTTCGDVKLISELQAGHFMHGKNKSTYFDERNVHPQCPRCNNWLSGNLIKYTRFMQDEYGDCVIDELEEKHLKLHIWKRQDLEELYGRYK